MQTNQEVQKAFHSIGISPKLEPFNHRVLSILAASLLGVISLWIFLIHETNNAREFMRSIFVVTVCTGIFVSFASITLITKKLFSFMKTLNEYLNESK